MDEMQKNIKVRSEAFAFRFVIILLAIWGLYEAYYAFNNKLSFNMAPMIIQIIALLFQSFLSFILERRMIKGDEEYKGSNKILWNILLTIVVAIIIMIVSINLIVSIILKV